MTEKLLIQIFNENIKTSLIKGQQILGWQLDPVWLWPQEPLELRRGLVLRGKLKACNLHLHNVKTVQLVDIEGKTWSQCHQPLTKNSNERPRGIWGKGHRSVSTKLGPTLLCAQLW